MADQVEDVAPEQLPVAVEQTGLSPNGAGRVFHEGVEVSVVEAEPIADNTVALEGEEFSEEVIELDDAVLGELVDDYRSLYGDDLDEYEHGDVDVAEYE